MLIIKSLIVAIIFTILLVYTIDGFSRIRKGSKSNGILAVVCGIIGIITFYILIVIIF